MSIACLQHKHNRPRQLKIDSWGQNAWATLYRTHWPAVRRRCKRVLGDRQAAEDAAQETFVRAFLHLDDRADPEHQRRWLLHVANNYCLNQLRDGKRQAALLSRLNAGDADDFASTLMARDAAAQVMRGMPVHVRGVAWLKYVEEMEQQQVARTLGISRRTVVARLAVFRASAQRAMERIEEPREPPRPALQR